MLTTSNTQYNTQRIKTVAAVQTFKKQYSFEACIAAVADPWEGPGGGGGGGGGGGPPPPPYSLQLWRILGWGRPPPRCFSTKMRPEGPKKKFLESGLPPHLRV